MIYPQAVAGYTFLFVGGLLGLMAGASLCFIRNDEDDQLRYGLVGFGGLLCAVCAMMCFGVA